MFVLNLKFEKKITMKNVLISIIVFLFAQNLLADEYTEWGSYEAGGWSWKVIIIPKNSSSEAPLYIAKDISKKYPKTRVRFFNDDTKIQQFVDRDRYFNDRTGKVKKVPFPTIWVKAHHIANINERSNRARKKWQLVTRYGEHIAYLE